MANGGESSRVSWQTRRRTSKSILSCPALDMTLISRPSPATSEGLFDIFQTIGVIRAHVDSLNHCDYRSFPRCRDINSFASCMSPSGPSSMAMTQVGLLVWSCVLWNVLTTGVGCTTSILGYASFIEYFNLDATTIGAFNSAYYGGCFVGCIMTWFLPDRIGRLRTIQISCVISLLGVSMQVGSQSFPVFCTGRIIGGVACGMIFSVCPVYASEIAPPEFRGRVGGIYA